MRLDYPLYIVAAACLISAVAYATSVTETTLYVYALAVLGIVLIGVGYMARPRKITIPKATPAPATKPAAKQAEKQEARPEAMPKEKTKTKPTRKTTRKRRATRRRTKKT